MVKNENIQENMLRDRKIRIQKIWKSTGKGITIVLSFLLEFYVFIVVFISKDNIQIMPFLNKFSLLHVKGSFPVLLAEPFTFPDQDWVVFT